MPAGVLEYLWFRDDDPWWATLLRAVALIALLVLFVLKGMHKVPSGSKALRTRFNKVIHHRRNTYDRINEKIRLRGEAKVVGPGLVIGIPFVHNVMIESLTSRGPWLVSPTTKVRWSIVVPRPFGASSRKRPSATMTSQLACWQTNRCSSALLTWASNCWSSMWQAPTSPSRLSWPTPSGRRGSSLRALRPPYWPRGQSTVQSAQHH
jgi:hypothetical protein